MNLVYGDEETNAFSPLYRSHIIKNEKVEISFDFAEGFELKGEKCGFEVAGVDGEYKIADFILDGDKILVFSNEIAEPVKVRYQWTNYGDVTLYGKNGLPVAPFRT